MTFDDLEPRLTKHHDVTVGQPASEDAIAAAERALTMRFAPRLREYLRRYGHLEIGSNAVYGLGPGVPRHLDLVRMTLAERDDTTGLALRADLVPLHNDGFGNLTCIAGDGSIVWWNHEAGPRQRPRRVAADLAAWLVELLDDADAA